MQWAKPRSQTKQCQDDPLGMKQILSIALVCLPSLTYGLMDIKQSRG